MRPLLALSLTLVALARPLAAFVQLNPPSVWPDGDITMHLQLGPATSPLTDGAASWDAAAKAALNAWNPSMERVKFVSVPNSGAAVGDGNGVNNVIFSSTIYARAYGDGVLAVTTHWRNGSRRTEADVLFNTKYTWDSYRGPLRTGANTAEFTRVAIHEFGHALGLGHPDQDGQAVSAIMNSSVSNLDGLQPDDTNGARFIYVNRTGLETPTFLIPLVGTSVVAGANIELSVTVTGTPPFIYTWTKDRIRQVNQSAKLTLANAQTGAAGTYAVTVTNPAGSAVSEAIVKITTFTAVPSIVTQPANVTAKTGFNATLSVSADGTAPLRFQWFKNGVAYGPSSESDSLNLSSVQPADAGTYFVTVTNSAGAVTSSAATLTITAASTAPVFTLQPVSQTAAFDSTVVFNAAVSGTPQSLRWQLNGSPLAAATSPTLVLKRVTATDAGVYTCVAFNQTGAQPATVTSSPATLTISSTADIGRLINLSILTDVTAATPLFTVGTVIKTNAPSGSKPLLIRAAGPALIPLGVPGTLADPKLEIFSGSTSIAANDNWGTESNLAAVFTQVGAFPYPSPTSKDAATFYTATTPPGSYTIQVSGVGGSTGTVIAELYDTTPAATFNASTARLINVSVRKQIPAGAILTAGFVIGGQTSRTVLIRVIGPALSAFGITTALTDPRLALFNNNSVQIAENDNWGGDAQLTSTSATVGAFPLTDLAGKDAVLLIMLAPGSYTVQATGAPGRGGEALIEVYEVP